jgi:Zn-dependent peptidase ImmA (M78 family)
MTTINKVVIPITNSDPVQKAKDALLAVRKYQQDWRDYGVDRVNRYFDDVEGKWLEEFCAEPLTFEDVSPLIDINTIFKSLEIIGLSSSFVEKFIFPNWWKRALKNDNNSIHNLHNLIISISGRLQLNIDFSSEKSLFVFKEIPNLSYKLQRNINDTIIFIRISISIAKRISQLTSKNYIPVSSNPRLIRDWILKRRPCIDLDGLIYFCWEHGIPVVHPSIYGQKKFKGMSSFGGMVAMYQNNPVIVIGSVTQKSETLLSFCLAHELGRIACGHLRNGILVDELFSDELIDAERTEADAFATRLLFGNVTLLWREKLNSKKLYLEAIRLSRIYKVSSSFVTLNYAWHTKDWQGAMAVLKKLEPEANAPKKINAFLNQYIQPQNIDADSRDFLRRMNILAS